MWLPLVVLGAVICALQFRWSDVVWRVTPKLEFLQFPWRWMLVLGMILAALVALSLRPEPPTRRAIAVRALLMLVLAGGMAGLAAAWYWQPCDEEDNVAAQIQTLHQPGFEGTDEYTPQGTDTSEMGSEPVADANILMTLVGKPERIIVENPNHQQIPATVKTDRWQTEHMAADITTPIAGYAVLRLMEYPAWRVQRNGAEARNVTRRSDGEMVIPVEAGVNRIDVTWRTTGDQRAGIVLSLCGLAVTLAWNWAERRRRGNPLP